MSWKHLFRALVQRYQVVEKLSDWYPIRRAAQLTAYYIRRGENYGVNRMEKLKDSPKTQQLGEQAGKSVGRGLQKMKRVKDTFVTETSIGINQIKEELEKTRKR